MKHQHRRQLLAIVALAVPLALADLECAIGWGKDSSAMHKVTVEQINDGYCDCPLDGSDEPHTNACSGSTMGAFTGIPAVSEHR
jgi:Glucosidase II beta subunit-like